MSLVLAFTQVRYSLRLCDLGAGTSFLLPAWSAAVEMRGHFFVTGLAPFGHGRLAHDDLSEGTDFLCPRSLMPNMDWEAFQDAHHRPHLVMVDLPEVSDRRSQTTRLATLERLAEQLQFTGRYSMRAELTGVMVAFESDVDAKRFGDVLAARPSRRDESWASRSRCSFDRTAQRRISNSLRAARVKLAKKPRDD